MCAIIPTIFGLGSLIEDELSMKLNDNLMLMAKLMFEIVLGSEI